MYSSTLSPTRPDGLKSTSSPITISQHVVQGVANTFEVSPVDLQLNPLDNEVFVVTGVKIDFLDLPRPDVTLIGFDQGDFTASITTTRPSAQVGIGSSTCIASSRINYFSNVGESTPAASSLNEFKTLNYVQENAQDAPPASMEYLHIIATNDFFINLSSSNSPVQKVNTNVRIYGYRARATTGSLYAALVQSELLSS
jgi:hypothetical protein